MPTTYETADLPAWPVYALTVHEGGRVEASGPLVPAARHPDRTSAIDTVAGAAGRLGRPVRAEATEPDGTVWHLVVSPDGTVGELPDPGPRSRPPRRRPEKTDRAGAATGEAGVSPRRATETAQTPAGTGRGPVTPAGGPADTAHEPAETVRGLMGTAQDPAETARGLMGTAQGPVSTARIPVDTAQGPSETARGPVETVPVPPGTGGGAGVPAPVPVRRAGLVDAASGRSGPAADRSAGVPGRSGPVEAGAGRGGPEPAGRRGPAVESPVETGTYARSLAVVTDLLEAGHLDRAAALVTQLDEQAAAALGLSHPDALRVREVRARITALAGNPVAGVLLFRDIAERWHYRGNPGQAEAAAVRAETLWLQITDLDTALSAGIAVVRLRNQIPGERGEALAAAVEHKAWLEAAGGAVPGQAPREHPPAAPGPGSGPGPGLSWERPAREVRTTT